MPSTDPKPKLTAKASMAQPVSQPAVYANGLIINSQYVSGMFTPIFRRSNCQTSPSSQCTHLTTRLSDITTTITGLETIGIVRQFDLLKMGVNTPETC
jgi:hypothetical protein